MMDACKLHAREAFRDLAELVNVKLFVDFPDDPSACRAQDPKNRQLEIHDLCKRDPPAPQPLRRTLLTSEL
jgi:hypothetical protein